MRGTVTHRPATDNQIRFAAQLAVQAGLDIPTMDGMTTAEASALIDELKAQAGPRMATDKQVQFAKNLLHDREVQGMDPAAQAIAHGHFVPGLTQPRPTAQDASTLIDALLSQPRRKEADLPEFPSIEDGYFAYDGDEGHTVFVRVWTAERSGQRGVAVQAGDDFHNLPPKTAHAVAQRLATDPQAAMERYGREIGRCGRCNRTLTDEISREIGIGPVCRGK